MKIVEIFPKFLGILFIISFMPSSINSMDQIRGFIDTVSKPFGVIKNYVLGKKNSLEIECILEYILETRIVQTELFSKLLSNRKWQRFRRIVPNDEIKNLKIYKEEMTEYYFEKFEKEDEEKAIKKSEINDESMEKLAKKDAANKKTEQCFSMNRKAFVKEGNYLSMEKLLNLTENQLILPKIWADKLENLQNCLLDFLFNSKFYTFGSIEPIFLDKLKVKTNEEKALLMAYRIKNRENLNFVLQWKWGKTKLKKVIYEDGDYGFQALKKCEQFVLMINKKNGPPQSSIHLEKTNLRHHLNSNTKLKGKEKMVENEKIDLMVLLKYFKKEQLFFRQLSITHFLEIECVLEYILETRIVQTEIFAKHLILKSWQILRRIVPNDEIKNLKIYKEKMTEYYFKKLGNEDEAIQKSEINDESMEKLAKKDAANKKTEQCFSMNRKALVEEGNYLSMKKLLNLRGNQLILPKRWVEKMDHLENCLLNFLVDSKFHTFGSIKPIFLDKLKNKTNEEKKLLMPFEFKERKNRNVVLQWNWMKEKPVEAFKEGDYEFEELNKCKQMELVINYKKNAKGQMEANENETIDLMELLKYFKEEQLFLETFPYVLKFKTYMSESEPSCPICLKEFEENEELERLYCGHYFHSACINEWIFKYNNNNCPSCKAPYDHFKMNF